MLDKIANTLLNTDDKRSNETYKEWKYRQARNILALLAPELEKARFWDEHVKSLPTIEKNIRELSEKARKWDKFHSYIEGECTLCPACGACMHVNYCILNTIEYDILTGLQRTMMKSDILTEKEDGDG